MKKDTREQLNTELHKEKDVDAKKIVELLEKAKSEPGHPTQRERHLFGVEKRDNYRKDWWSEDERLQCVATFAVTGNATHTARLTGIPVQTIRRWKSEDWWPEMMEKLKAEADEETDAKFTKIINKSLDLIETRLEEGDWIYDVKQGKLIPKPVNARDLAAVTATSIDKRQLLRGQPTSRTESVSASRRLDKLMDEFKKFAKAKTIDSQPEEVIREEKTP